MSTAATATDIRKEFRDAGFEVAEIQAQPETIEVRKGNCSRLLARGATGAWSFASPNYFEIRGTKYELEDRGYQKFWYANGQRIPIRVVDLQTLHHFDQELRAVLGAKSLYNESLGSTCARSVYDRLTGRPDR